MPRAPKDISITVGGVPYTITRSAQSNYCRIYDVPVTPLSPDEVAHVTQELELYLTGNKRRDLSFRVKQGNIEAIFERGKKSDSVDIDVTAPDPKAAHRERAAEAEAEADDQFFKRYAGRKMKE